MLKKKTSARRKPAQTHPFNEAELQLMATANTRLNGKMKERFALLKRAIGVDYVQERNFTKCVIRTPKSIHVGVAKRNPTDNINPAVGKNIAFYRALTEEPVRF